MKSTSASIWFIFITVFLDVLGLGIIIPVVPDLIQELTGKDISQASEIGGYLIFSFAFTQFLFAPIMGELSDHFGRRKVLLYTLLGLGLDYFFHAFASSLFLLFVGRILSGVTGASYSVANAYIADISTRENKAKNFGMVGAAFGLGFTVGPVLGGVAGHHLGVRSPFIIAGVLTLLNVLYGYFVLPESLPVERRRPINIKNFNPLKIVDRLAKFPSLKWMFLVLFLVNVGQHAVHSTWNYYTQLRFGWNSDMVGYSLGTAGVLVSLVQGGLIGIFIRKFGNTKTILIGLCCWVLGLFLFGTAQEGYLMFIYLLPYCLGGMAGPAIQSFITGQVDENEQGALQGVVTSVQSLTSIFGPLLMASFLFHTFTEDDAPIYLPGISFYVGAFLVAIALLIYIFKVKKRLN